MEAFKYEVYIDCDDGNLYFEETSYPEGILGVEGPEAEFGLMCITANYQEYDTYSKAVANPLWF